MSPPQRDDVTATSPLKGGPFEDGKDGTVTNPPFWRFPQQFSPLYFSLLFPSLPSPSRGQFVTFCIMARSAAKWGGEMSSPRRCDGQAKAKGGDGEDRHPPSLPLKSPPLALQEADVNHARLPQSLRSSLCPRSPGGGRRGEEPQMEGALSIIVTNY